MKSTRPMISIVSFILSEVTEAAVKGSAVAFPIRVADGAITIVSLPGLLFA
jgi:hypothetical protein